MSTNQLILHSENGIHTGFEYEQKVLFKVDPPVYLDPADYVMAVTNFCFESDALMIYVECGFKYQMDDDEHEGHFYANITARDLKEFVDELNWYMSGKIPTNHPPIIKLGVKQKTLTFSAGRQRIWDMTSDMVKVLGLNRNSFGSGTRSKEQFEPSLPILVPMILEVGCCEPNTTLVAKNGDQLRLASLLSFDTFLTVTSAAPRVRPTHLEWVKLKGHTIREVTVVIRYASNGLPVCCLDWLDRFTLTLAYKRSLSLAFQ